MKTKAFFVFASIVSFCVVISISCSKEVSSYNVNSRELVLPAQPYQYFSGDDELATLGRVLFYDNSLSVNNAVSCGSCHKQAFAFSDNKAFSKGFENLLTERNTPPIQNLMRAQSLFWDGREKSLTNMVMQPLFNHIEMGIPGPTNLVRKVEGKAYYSKLFADAFGSDSVTPQRIAAALSSFTGSINSFNSRFEKGAFSQIGISKLTELEEKGLSLFFEKYNCGSCHQLFSSVGYSEPIGMELINIGLDMNYQDQGGGALTGAPVDNGKFKIPNLRNVAVTGPYMHDGRFETLEEVIDHYSDGVKNHPNLDSRLKGANGQAVVFNISEEEKAALVAFLGSLTDNDLLGDPKFSDPFQ